MSEVSIFKIIKCELLSSTNPDLEPIQLNYPIRDPDTGKAGLISLTVEETMYAPSISGEAVLRDFDGAGNEFLPALFASGDQGLVGLGGYDILRVEFSKEEGTTDPVSLKVDFLIYAYSQETNELFSTIQPTSTPRIITLKLASPEFALMNYAFYEYFEGDEDIIRPISKNLPEEQNQTEEEIAELLSSSEPEGKEYNGEGMVQYLVKRLNDKMSESISDFIEPKLASEDTKNWIWLKTKYNFYPWGKMVSPPLVSQLINMMVENSVHPEWDRGKKAANFFFWRTMDAWNFFSLETLVKQEPAKTYFLIPNIDTDRSIRSLVSDEVDEGVLSFYNETDFLTLMESYAFGSNYLFVEPKYSEDPYARYLDANNAHTIKEITYDYIKDGNSWSKLPQDDIQQTPIIGTSLNYKEGSVLANLYKNRITETNYGYFSSGFFNKKKTVAWEYYGYDYSSREEDTLWQTQFDITDLEGQKLYWIQKEIKKKLRNKRREYAKKKNLKEKWKVYRCSICCAGLSDEFAGITAGKTAETSVNEQDQIDDLSLEPQQTEGQIQGSGSTGDSKTPKFTDPRFLESFNLRNVKANLSDYEIVAAGSFTDVINYDSALLSGLSGASGASGESSLDLNDPWVRSGMTLSYNLNESPYNMSLGEFMNLQKTPDSFVKYRFDLEILRHQKLKEILQRNIHARNVRAGQYVNSMKGYTSAYLDRSDVCLRDGCTGYCLCPTEYPETVNIKGNFVISAHAALSQHEAQILENIDPVIEKLKLLKEEFVSLYNKFWSRKAFFFSKNIDFSFLKSGNNLFNVKSIKKMPIKDSKYAPFAIRKPISILGFSGSTGLSLANTGFSGSTKDSCYYPYGFTFYSRQIIEGSEGSSGSDDLCGITLNTYYQRKYTDNTKADFWYSFGFPSASGSSGSESNDSESSNSGPTGMFFSNFPYSEPGVERPKGPIWYRNWLVLYDIVLIKPPCLNRKPPCFEGDCTCDEIVLPLKMHFESFANDKGATVLNSPIEVGTYALTELAKNCDACKVRITAVVPSSDVRLYHPWAADYLVPGFSYSDYVEYQKSASLFDDNLSQKIPPHVQLEGLESYVRVEFKTPIGLGTLESFPEGFHDTYGSEYFLPYIVLATAGPFGAESARANISVIGQDPYGFDLAVKKTKNKDDFAGMNLLYTDGLSMSSGEEWKSDTNSLMNPFSTSSSWLKHSQNSLFYKPKDGIADVFVPTGIQDIFMASSLQNSMPVKSWWDMWVSLPPIAVATFYNRSDVFGASGNSLMLSIGDDGTNPPDQGVTSFVGVAFYTKGSIVAEPVSWTGDTGCTGGCSADRPWPLFLQPDTEQIISGAFPSNSVVVPADKSLESSGYLGSFITGPLDPGGFTGSTFGIATYILPADPSNYIYRFAEFPHIEGIGPSGDSKGITGIKKNNEYSVISYPVGTLIWGKNLKSSVSAESDVSGDSGPSEKDYNQIWKYDISRKTQYGIVQLNSDALPSLLGLVGGIGGNTQKIEEYNRWVYNKVLDWYQNSIFDNNFSAQFVVMSKSSNGCGKEYPCMNPAGFPGTDGCPPEDPLCNCPCQGKDKNKGKLLSSYVQPGSTASMPSEIVLRPDLMDVYEDKFVGITLGNTGSYGKEPSTLELQLLESEIYECELIKKHPQLGEEYLGCVWDEPESTYNCTCPKIGKKFPEYMKYNRTNATFWETPLETPLYRTAQMALFNSNKIQISVAGDLALVPGWVIDLKAKVGDKPKRFSGKWLITTIKHQFNPNYHMMDLVLSRELPHPNSQEEETGDNLDVNA